MTVRYFSPLIHMYLTLDTSPAINELPFGALRKAQRTLDRTHVDSDDGDDSNRSYSTEGQQLDDNSDEESREEVEPGIKASKRDAATTARKSKHA